MSIEARLRAELRAWADELGPDAGPEVTAASLTGLHHRRLRHRAALLAAAVAVVLVAVAVPYTLARLHDRSAPASPSSLFDLPTRGPLAGDEDFLADAVRLPWEQIDPPMNTRHVVWAGDVPGGQRWVLVAGKNTTAPANQDPRDQTDAGALSPTALALFTGPAGAPADQLSLANAPHGQGVHEPFAVQDAGTGTLLVVAAPGDAIEVSGRPVFAADGTESRSWRDAAGSDGVALLGLQPLLATGPTPVAYEVFRDRVEIDGGRVPDVLGQPATRELALATVHGPLPAEDDAQQAAAQLVTQLGIDRGDPDALIAWQGQVPGPDDGGPPATVTAAAVTAPSGAVLADVQWRRPLDGPLVDGAYGGMCVVRAVLPDGWPADQRTYAFSCTVLGSDEGQQATTFVIAAPPTAVHARLYGAGGDLVAETDLVDGVAVLPTDQTAGQRPAFSVEAFTTDGTTLQRTPVLSG